MGLSAPQAVRRLRTHRVQRAERAGGRRLRADPFAPGEQRSAGPAGSDSEKGIGWNRQRRSAGERLVNYQPRFSTEAEAFKSCFSGVASFLGRPSAPTVLFSGIPIGPNAVTFEEIEFVAESCRHRSQDLHAHRLRPSSRRAAGHRLLRRPAARRPAFGERSRFEFLTVPQDGGRTSFSRKEMLEARSPASSASR